jgi:hypothetical protein
LFDIALQAIPELTVGFAFICNVWGVSPKIDETATNPPG